MVNEPEGAVPYDKNRYSKRKRLLIVYSQISILYVLPKIYETLRTMCMNAVNTVKRALEDATCSLLDAIVRQYMFESDIVSPRRFPSYMISSPACLRMVSSAARERGLIEQL